jgi:hypothetical protein
MFDLHQHQHIRLSFILFTYKLTRIYRVYLLITYKSRLYTHLIRIIMSNYALIYDELTDEISYDDAEAFLMTKMKLSADSVAAFFNGEPVILAAEAKLKALQTVFEKVGIKASKEIQPIDPSEAGLSHIYEKLLAMETEITKLSAKVESNSHASSSEVMNTIGKNLKDGLDKASSVASSLKDSSSNKLTQLQTTANEPQDQVEFVPQEKPKGFSWMGFLFGPHYYAGYGDIKKGIIFAILSGTLPLIAIFVHIFTGVKANKELPVKQVLFKWPNAALSFLTYLIVSSLFVALLSTSNLGVFGNVAMIKEGTLYVEPSVTIEGAFDNYKYFSTTSWESYDDPQGRSIVEFKGNIDVNKFSGVKYLRSNITNKMISKALQQNKLTMTYIAKFAISKVDDTFTLHSSGLNFTGIKNDEPVSKYIEDEKEEVLAAIYANEPEPMTIGILLSI